ncbi:hypothetical protein hbim_05890 [Mycolicibacterium mageritense]|uniref:DUF4440 domain-containing protein n=1 Tax=Mycolicibacterium mageritense TaxID=53462 RepID=A0AAI8XRC7_MYCME|nr:hypothetical protein hbim_05890 [Mycolicibacterium mageritense]
MSQEPESGYSCRVTGNSVFDALIDLERAGWDSLCAGKGSDFYGATMLPDAVMVLANGMVMDRDTVTAALAESPPWRTYDIYDARLVQFDDANAGLVYTAKAHRDGTDTAFVGVMSSIYHLTGDGWKLALYQQTQIAA